MTRCPSCGAAADAASRFCPECGAALQTGVPTTPLAATPLLTPAAAHAAANASVGDGGRFLPGTLLAGRYRLVALLGRGGMGEVYRADDTKLGQTVALKFLPDALTRDDESRERFYAEVRVGRQVSHPNVCRLYDLAEIEGHMCLSMEYVDGEDLATLLQRIGRLPTDKAVEIAREVCAGLAAAHDKNVIHRDLKPANVMIDGRGRARITDFGLATFAEDLAREALAGTPAYMAPEQLDGQPASIRSDIYALGLLLYETFTGKRLFEARTLNELKALHAQARPPSLSSTVRDIPPEVERIVQRCLERDPAARPTSVHAVSAALPGGDPLQAALAAGDTPSPAMVAAAGKVGDLSLRAAWAILVAAIAGLFLLAHLSATTTVIGRLRPEKPPEVLREKAREIIARTGYPERPADSAAWFWFDREYLQSLGGEAPTSESWTRIDRARPGPLRFIYRQSPDQLVARRASVAFVLPSDVGRIEADDPPLDVPGMSRVVLDRHGRLVEFLAVPPKREQAPATRDVDWAAVLSEAGLDLAQLEATSPQWSAPVDSDTKLAWTGAYREQPGVPLRIEAAAYHGKPVWLSVQGPWVQPRTAEVADIDRITVGLVLLFGFAMLIGTTAMLRRNLRLGRGDRRGALRLGWAIFGALALALLLRADHSASLVEEAPLLVNVFSQALYFAVWTWLLYLAFEPYARRRWPGLMISWSRLLAGRLRDPMVGRDVLLGGLVGIALTLVVHLSVLVPSGLSHVQRAPLAQVVTSLTAARHLEFFMLVNVYTAVAMGLGCLFGLFLFRAILRNDLAAIAMQFIFTYLFFLVATSSSNAWSLAIVLLAALWLALLVRVGMLAAIASTYFMFVLDATPLTLDIGAWYGGRTLICLGTLLAILAYAFHLSLGGKSPLGQVLLEHDEVKR